MAHGSPSCWLWMLSLFKVWQLYLAFFFFLPKWLGKFWFWYMLFLFLILTMDYTDHVVQANFLQKNIYTKKEIYGKYIQIVLCNKGNMQIFF